MYKILSILSRHQFNRWTAKTFAWNQIAPWSIKWLEPLQCKHILSVQKSRKLSLQTATRSSIKQNKLQIVRDVFPEMLWFGLLIWKEIHLLIDWCIFWNRAADWFTHGLIAIYVRVSMASCWAIKSCKTGVCSPNTRLQRFDQDQDNFYCCPLESQSHHSSRGSLVIHHYSFHAGVFQERWIFLISPAPHFLTGWIMLHY